MSIIHAVRPIALPVAAAAIAVAATLAVGDVGTSAGPVSPAQFHGQQVPRTHPNGPSHGYVLAGKKLLGKKL